MKKDKTWVANEKIINRDPTLKAARDTAEGFKPKPGATHGGKGSARRGSDDKLYADNWEKIFGNKNK
jgi:hypothetical protein